jgi:hypothetical protein
MDFDEIRQIALSFPGVEEHLVFGSSTFRVGKRFLACIAKIDPDTLVLKMSDPIEREYWLTTKPEIYYNAPHYADFQSILIRMPLVEPEELRQLFQNTWRTYASKKLVANYSSK